MQELAPLTILAISFLMVLLTHFCFVVWGKMLLWYEFVPAMSIWTWITVFTMMIHDDISAHFCFLHFFNFLVELEAFLPVHELLLLWGSCGFSGKVRYIIEVVREIVNEGGKTRMYLWKWILLLMWREVWCCLIACHLAFGMVHTWSLHPSLSEIIINDIHIRITVLISGCQGYCGRYLLELLALILVQRNQTAIIWLVLISILILTKFAELTLKAWL